MPSSASQSTIRAQRDEQVLFLGDIFPTGWEAVVQCDIQPSDTVAIWADRTSVLLPGRAA